jgi:hypothetical protein
MLPKEDFDAEFKDGPSQNTNSHVISGKVVFFWVGFGMLLTDSYP